MRTMASWTSKEVPPAEELCDLMRSVGVVPGVVTFNGLIDAGVKAGDVKFAEEIFERMRSGGLAPDVFTFSSLIAAYAKTGKLETAGIFFERMRLAGVFPNGVTFSSLMDRVTFSSLKVACEAEETFDRTRSPGEVPDLVTFNNLIAACIMAGDVKLAEEIFERSAGMDRRGKAPDVMTNPVVSDRRGKGKGSVGFTLWPSRLATSRKPRRSL